jgi:hypothetical protein
LPLRYLFIALTLLIAVPIAAWFAWGRVEAARLDRALDALEARHEPLDVAAFDRKPTTPAQREASHLYAQAGKLADHAPITMQQAAALSTTIETVCLPSVAASERNQQIRVLLDFERRYPPVFDLLERASRLDAAGWDEADRPQRYSMEEMRPITLTRANVVRIARLACSGDGDGGARALLSSLRLRRVWVGGQIAPIAMQTSHSLQAVLTWTQPSPALLDELQQEYIASADETRFQNWMKRERAVWLSNALPGEFSDAPRGYPDRRITPIEAVSLRIVRPLRDRRLVDELEEFDRAIAIAESPWPAKLDAIDEFSKARPSRRSQSIQPALIDVLSRPLGSHIAANALAGYIVGMTETLARNRASAAAIAVARYQRDHSGACPGTLQQLVPDYFPSPQVDPFSGSEFKYQCDANGYKVYSVGANRKDDGGQWEQHSDLQLSRRGNPPDIGIIVTRSTETQKHKTQK